MRDDLMLKSVRKTENTVRRRSSRDNWLDAEDQRIAMNIWTCLMHFYPNHFWGVTCDVRNGVAVVRLDALMKENQGWIIHLSDFDTPHAFTAIVRRAGGEILERLRLPRSNADLDLVAEYQHLHPKAHRQALPN
jgi:hypothetical protein